MAEDSTEQIAKYAYNISRGGFRGKGLCPMPRWDDAPDWVRDAMVVAVLSGSMLRPPRMGGDNA